MWTLCMIRSIIKYISELIIDYVNKYLLHIINYKT